ncbi:signal peptidase II [Paenibacillus xerothermodurans]|uniref:Lipoprotein signal peptidase n=1 Tax=Paenibacillus xerothermodurans TaxID=1977292 RepID=A0A2W1NVM1_PAEXE|nr:signal peptidase II [Paenibacillus xerothermodurans]PZE22633.1 lipoprotein signal peptidase [Paenibacillus xerothermodurans]
MRYYIYAFIVLLLDQATKWIIVNRMQLGESIPVIGEFFQITSHRNRGAAFGILQNQRAFFIVITIAVVVGLIWYLKKMVQEGRRLLPFALSLLLGGALGNFIDRVLFGEVVDFLQFRFQFDWFGTAVDYTYPIFNIADAAIVVGVILIFLDTFSSWRNEKRGTVNV